MQTVLHVIFYTGLYGAEQSLLALVRELPSRGINSIVAVYKPGPLTEKLEELGVTVVYMSGLKPWLIERKHSWLKRRLYNIYHLPFLIRSSIALKKIIQEYQVDLVHTSTTITFDGALAAKLANVPHVWHIRETIEPDKRLGFFLGTGIARKLIKLFSDRIIAISNAIAKPYHDPDKVKVIHNGVDLNLYNKTPIKLTLLQNLGIPENAQIISLIAGVEPRKRHEDFLNAAAIIDKSVPNVFLLFVGGDLTKPTEYMQTMQQLSVDLGLKERTLWLGFYENIKEIYPQINILVLPSEDEPFGRVLIETMAARKPVVATQVGGIPEIVLNGVTGLLVPPKSPDDLAQAIIKLLKNPTLAKKMGQAGRRRVERLFTVEHYVDNVEAVYRELLD